MPVDQQTPGKEGRTSTVKAKEQENSKKNKHQAVLKPVLKRLSDIRSEDVKWLWEPYIAKGKITLLEGDPNDGKTFIALAVASIVSQGWGFPGEDGRPLERTEPGSVLYLTAEDGLADTIRPRVDMLGGDPNNIHILDGFFRDGQEDSIESVTLQDINVIRAAIEETNPCLIVVDPLQAYMGASVDIHRANEVRPVLSRVSKLAEEHNVALLFIRHLSKARTDRAMYRGNGSIDFSAAARSILMVGKNPDEPEKRAIVQIKNSLLQCGDSIGFCIDGMGFTWTGKSDLTVEKMLGPKDNEDIGDRSAVDEARNFLEDMLESFPVPSKAIFAEAKKACISAASIRRAKEHMNIKIFKEQGKDGRWMWKLNPPSYSDEQVEQDSINHNKSGLNNVTQVAQDNYNERLETVWAAISRKIESS